MQEKPEQEGITGPNSGVPTLDTKAGPYAGEIYTRLNQPGAPRALGEELLHRVVARGFEDPFAPGANIQSASRPERGDLMGNLPYEIFKEEILGKEQAFRQIKENLELWASQPGTNFTIAFGEASSGWKWFLRLGADWGEFLGDKAEPQRLLGEMRKKINLAAELGRLSDWQEKLQLVAALGKITGISEIEDQNILIFKNELFYRLNNPGSDLNWFVYLQNYEAATLVFGKNSVNAECGLSKFWDKILADVENARSNSPDFIPMAAVAQRLCPEGLPCPKASEEEFDAYKARVLEKYTKNKNPWELVTGVAAVKGLRVYSGRDEF